MSRTEALVKSELLVWARESAGFALAEAAEKAKVKAESLEHWEQGTSRPTIGQLRELARVYKRPLAVFYLPRPPKDFQAMHDFRRLPRGAIRQESPALRLEIRKARYRRQVALELHEALGGQPPELKLEGRLGDDAEQLAEQARAALGVGLDEQLAWRSSYEALNGWRAALERLSILVFQSGGVEIEEMRGFSLPEAVLPTIVVNIKDHPHGRIFTMLHELAHLMLRETGICNFSEDTLKPPEELRIEAFCNRIAGAILLPREALLREELILEGTPPSWGDAEIQALSGKYRVSREALLRRLLVLGKTSEELYLQKRRQWQEEFARRKARDAGGYASPDKLAVTRVGPAFVRLVLDSFYQEKITSSDVADFLEVRLKWLPKIEAAIFGQRRDGWAFA